jgi:putative ABC transport system permease protein
MISAQLFRKYFPSTAGSRVILIDGEFDKRSETSERLEYLFQDYGMVVTPASERLAQFNSVENTYLTVFMLLGGLGVILGTFGLGIVVMRNISERQPEIALYLAIGFKRKFVSRLLATEYLLILLAGILIGTLSAFIGLLPSIFRAGTILPWSYIIVILLLVLSSGLLWIHFPIKSALKKNIIHSLQAE